jgi:hypothetical protein
MTMKRHRRQQGWAVVVILVALAIAAFLGRDALLAYFGRGSAATRALESRLPVDTADPGDSTRSVSTPRAPLDRARALEETVHKHAEEASRRIDGAAR